MQEYSKNIREAWCTGDGASTIDWIDETSDHRSLIPLSPGIIVVRHGDMGRQPPLLIDISDFSLKEES